MVKKGIRRAMVSMLILTLVGAGLCFWLYQTGDYDTESQRASVEGKEPGLEKGMMQKAAQEEMQGKDGQAPDGGIQAAEGGSVQATAGDGGGLPEGSVQAAAGDGGGLPEGTGQFQEDAQGGGQQDASLVFAGDIYLSNYVLEQYNNEGINGVISENLLAEMRQADIVMANEEFPFSARGEQAEDKQFTFRVDPSYIKIFQELGIDVVSLANNHALDYGPDALTDSFQALDGAGIAYVGAGEDRARASKPFFAQAGGKTFGFLGASRVIPVAGWNIENQQPGMLCTYDSGALCEAIRQAKPQCDFLAVYVHWGIERENMPKEYQRQLAKEYIDAGADLVVGAHPHVLQGIEYYNGKPIVYSLGNYIFNQEIASSALLKVTVTPENESRLQLVPAYATGAKTQGMDKEQAAELYRFMEGISYGVRIGEDGAVQPESAE